MKLKRKLLKIILIILVAVIILAALIFHFAGEYLIKTGIETAAVKALSVGVYIDDLDLALTKGDVTIKGLTVNNPPGYKSENLLQLKKCYVNTNLSSLLSDTVIIRRLHLDGMNVTIEQKGFTNNLQQVLNSIERRPEKPDKKTKKLEIEELQISDVTVNATLIPIPGQSENVSMKLSRITMKNLGGDNKLDTAALTQTIFLELATDIAKKGTDILPRDAVKTIRSTLEETFDVGKAATKEGQKVLEKGKEIGEGVIKGIEGILKPEDEKKTPEK